jgi:hypothetical protein
LSILPRRGSNYTYPLSIFRYYRPIGQASGGKGILRTP